MTSKRHAKDRFTQPQRISGPQELLQAVPYLLGFHPHDSVVLVGLDGEVLVVTARLDLRDVEDGALPHAFGAIARGGATAVLAVVYDEAAWAHDPAIREFVVLLTAEAALARCRLMEVLLAARGRWWPLTCEPGCCPPEGRELPAATSAFAAAATYDGVVALADRAELAALLDRVPDADGGAALQPRIEAAERAAVRQALDGQGQRYERSVKRALFAAARESVAPGWAAVPDDAHVVRLGVGLRTSTVADAVWLAVDDGRLDGRPLWRDLARRLPSPYDAPALFLFGWAAWRAGEGTLAGIAAERAIESDPSCTRAELLLAAVANGVNPRRFPRLRQRSA